MAMVMVRTSWGQWLTRGWDEDVNYAHHRHASSSECKSQLRAVVANVHQANTSFWWIKLRYLASIDNGCTVSSYSLATCIEPPFILSSNPRDVIHCSTWSIAPAFADLYPSACRSIHHLGFYPSSKGCSFLSTSIPPPIHWSFFASPRVVEFLYSTCYK